MQQRISLQHHLATNHEERPDKGSCADCAGNQLPEGD
jgi:hypothetical protein